jgi:hypothetical protein
LTIIYPPESFSIYLHILIMVLATIVAIVGLYWGSIAYERKDAKGNPIILKLDPIVKEIIPIGGIILAFLGPFITGVSNSVLDYNVSADVTRNTLKVMINNNGLVSAKNIEIYYNATGTNFSKFVSMPIIKDSMYSNSTELNSKGSGLFFIPVLPPRSETTIITQPESKLKNDTTVTVYVRSEASTGVHNFVALTAAYLIYGLALAYSVIFIILKKWNVSKFYKGVLIVDISAAVAILLVTVLGACDGNINCLISHGLSI